MVRRSRNLSDAVDLAVIDKDAAIFAISVAAELAGMHPQTLRTYDRLGLVVPERTRGRGRRYSMRDVAALRMVQHLSQEEGINLNGIRRILQMERRIEQLSEQVDELTDTVKIRESLLLSRPAGCIWVGRSFMPSWHCLLIVVDFRPRWCGLL